MYRVYGDAPKYRDDEKIAVDLSALQGMNFPRLNGSDIFKGMEFMSEENQSAVNNYLQAFVKSPEPGKCVCCKSELGGILGTFVMGFAYGEGKCGKCDYPCRAYHRNFGPVKILPAILQYHPDDLTQNSTED